MDKGVGVSSSEAIGIGIDFQSDTPMIPTLHFRWKEATGTEEEGPCAVTVRFWPENGPTGFVLQQWWADNSRGEWRNVEIGTDDNPPLT